jgi:hypothetical protein
MKLVAEGRALRARMVLGNFDTLSEVVADTIIAQRQYSIRIKGHRSVVGLETMRNVNARVSVLKYP